MSYDYYNVEHLRSIVRLVVQTLLKRRDQGSAVRLMLDGLNEACEGIGGAEDLMDPVRRRPCVGSFDAARRLRESEGVVASEVGQGPRPEVGEDLDIAVDGDRAAGPDPDSAVVPVGNPVPAQTLDERVRQVLDLALASFVSEGAGVAGQVDGQSDGHDASPSGSRVLDTPGDATVGDGPDTLSDGSVSGESVGGQVDAPAPPADRATLDPVGHVPAADTGPTCCSSWPLCEHAIVAGGWLS